MNRPDQAIERKNLRLVAIFSIAFLVVLAIFPASAQTGDLPRAAKAAKSSKAAVQPSKPIALPNVKLGISESFDDRQLTLPPRFGGHDVAELFPHFSRRREEISKDEFETKDAYSQRLESFVRMLQPRKLAFGRRIGASYKPEQQKFEIMDVLLWQSFRDASGSTYAFQILEKDGPSRKYVAENVYGKRVLATEWNTTRWAVGLDMDKLRRTKNPAFRTQVSDGRPLGAISLALLMPVETARQVQNQLAILLVGAPEYPFAGKSFREKEATIDNPLSINFEYFVVTLNLEQIWLYNFDTGEIYQRLVLRDATGATQSADEKRGIERQKQTGRSAEQAIQTGNSYFGRRMYTEAAEQYRIAAEQNFASGQTNLGSMYQYGWGVTKDYAEAMRWFRKAAEQNNASAQNLIGGLYRNGLGVTKDYAEAMRWYRKAAEQDNASAQATMGGHYHFGWGVPEDPVEAMRWYRKAAEQNDSTAQNNIGKLYETGSGVPTDYTEAIRWYRKAAEQNDSTAQNNIGVMYSNGWGVAQDDAEAVRWFRKAAEKNNEWAQASLGYLYERGLGGLGRDLDEARKWYRKAAAQGHPGATASLKRLGWE